MPSEDALQAWVQTHTEPPKYGAAPSRARIYQPAARGNKRETAGCPPAAGCAAAPPAPAGPRPGLPPPRPSRPARPPRPRPGAPAEPGPGSALPGTARPRRGPAAAPHASPARPGAPFPAACRRAGAAAAAAPPSAPPARRGCAPGGARRRDGGGRRGAGRPPLTPRGGAAARPRQPTAPRPQKFGRGSLPRRDGARGRRLPRGLAGTHPPARTHAHAPNDTAKRHRRRRYLLAAALGSRRRRGVGAPRGRPRSAPRGGRQPQPAPPPAAPRAPSHPRRRRRAPPGPSAARPPAPPRPAGRPPELAAGARAGPPRRKLREKGERGSGKLEGAACRRALSCGGIPGQARCPTGAPALPGPADFWCGQAAPSSSHHPGGARPADERLDALAAFLGRRVATVSDLRVTEAGLCVLKTETSRTKTYFRYRLTNWELQPRPGTSLYCILYSQITEKTP